MAENKKTRLELEEQKKIADEVREAFDENSMKLRKSYSADAQKLLKEMDNYYGDVKESMIGKRLETFLENEKNVPSEFFRKELKHLPGWVPDHLLEDFYTSIDSIIKWQTSQYYYRRTMRTKRYGAFLDRYFRIMNEYHFMGIYGCDIVSLYKEKLPQDILCYYRDGSNNGYRIISEYWIQAELSDVRSNTTGHCYLEFIQKDPRSNSLVAKARGVIWNNIYRLLKPYFEESTGQLFTSGIKVLVKVTVQFHELYGYSLTVLDIDPTYTLGDMARRRREILLQLEEEGVLTLNKELEMPVLPQRIAVVSSATAAGYGDFCHQLKHNSGGFFFYTELFPALMQGNQVEESVLAALDCINARISEFDVVVIIRGGGAASDLSGFDTYLLAAACAQFPLPVITGIGHERDDTVLDSVAHTRVKTPTAAAELLIQRVGEAAERLEELSARLQQGAYTLLEQKQRRLVTMQARIPALVHRKLSEARFTLLTARKDLSQVTQNLLSRQRHRLELLQQRVADNSPEKLLSRGYSITLKDGKAVTDASLLQPGDQLTTRLLKGEVQSTVR